jgi:uroporphyrinogen-III synthase
MADGANIRVWVTREEPRGGPLSAALERCALRPVLEPVIERRCVGDAAAELATLGPGDWLVLTSAFTVECLAREEARVPRVAVVGPGTEDAARAAGLRVELVERRGGARELFGLLRRTGRPRRVCHPRSRQAAAMEPWSGLDLLSPVVYESVPRAFDRSVVERVDVAALASPSAVAAMGAVTLPLASIGATTSAAIRRLGMSVWVEAQEPSFEALARAIASARRLRSA